MDAIKRPCAAIEGGNVVVRVDGRIVFNMPEQTIASTFDQAMEALKACREELNTRIEEDGDCDHSVGICVCGLKRLIEDVDVITSTMEATYE